MSENEHIPNFDDTHIDWAVNALSVMSLRSAAHAFLLTFPDYSDEKYGSAPDIHQAILGRLTDIRYNKRRPYHDLIQARKAGMQGKVLDAFPYTNPLARLAKLHELLFFEDLKPMEQVRILTTIGKLADRLQGKDKAEVPENTWAGAKAEFEETPGTESHNGNHGGRRADP